MKLVLEREPSTVHSTPGRLFVDGVFECFTLEDVVRPAKVYGQTAVPPGSYRVVLTMSPRFKRVLPLLLEVPDFTGVRIHPGNTDKDTEGCVLVGQTRSRDFVGNSRAAFNTLFTKLQAARSPIYIEIKGA